LTESTKFYQASTSEMFGNALESPQNEETALSPRSPYAAAKVFAYWCTRNYRESEGLHATNGILFNHESPIRGETFVTRKITRAVAAIEAGLQDCLYVGNLNSKRDWGHAKDFVEGMRLMLQQEKPDDYVLATGEAHSVREFIELAFQETDREIVWEGEGLKEVGRDCKTGIELVKVLPEYFRPLEVHHLLGDASKAKTVLGWEPSVGFSDLVKEMVREDRNAIGNAARLSDAKPFQ
jgi:GDPmannose 4,6-dehydratase